MSIYLPDFLQGLSVCFFECVCQSVCQFACLSVYVHSKSFRPSVSLSVCTVCLSVILSARSVCLSTRSACLCLTPNWLHLLYLSNQCVILPPIILLLALLRDLDLSRVPESSAKLERVWKPRSELCNTRITLGSWEHIKPYSVQKGFWGQRGIQFRWFSFYRNCSVGSTCLWEQWSKYWTPTSWVFSLHEGDIATWNNQDKGKSLMSVSTLSHSSPVL